ncbi:MAG: riboflavin biosynthesis protein RibF [Planctomycetota bacterium]
MRILRSLEEARAAGFTRTVVTLGVFDGVHVGHRYVIRDTLSIAAEHAAASVVVTFVQHPRAIIAGAAPKLITPIEHRLRLFAELGVENVLALTFTDELRRVPAADFAHEVFEDVLAAQVVVLGHNCRFGRDREGGADWLLARADEFSFSTVHAEEIRIGSDIVSSTNIRAAIEAGELARAARMLGRPYALHGTVVTGQGRGRQLGFPTANLDVHHQLRPPRGVYGAEVRGDDGQRRHALVNIGVKPTFDGGAGEETVEVHLLDFSGDLYGRDLEVVFLTHIREERRFPDLEALRARIARDRLDFLAFLGAGEAPGKER